MTYCRTRNFSPDKTGILHAKLGQVHDKVTYENPSLPAESIWFQQDGAPPWNFASKVDRRKGSVEWPARSPDLTPLDFFLWSQAKKRVYVNRPQSIEELQERI